MKEPVDNISPDAVERRLQAEFDKWFAKLQELTNQKLDPEDWTERWFDGFTPSEALDHGPEE